MSAPRRTDTLNTYRHLRIAMVVLLFLLLVSVAVEAGRSRCFADSISAYYFTPVRAVFVATLCAVGACLVVYRGRTDGEDIALNVSGFLAFVVAFIPTEAPGQPATACSATNVPSDAQVADAITNNMIALVTTATVSVVVALVLVRRVGAKAGPAAVPSLVAFYGLLLFVGAYLTVARDHFLSWAHLGAAAAMFGGMILVVGFNAREARDTSATDPQVRARRFWYPKLFIAMAGTVVVVGPLTISDLLPRGALILEAMLLAEFGGFWFLQTQALWADAPDADPAATAKT